MDGRTDGQTNTDRQLVSRLRIVSRGKKNERTRNVINRVRTASVD